MRVLSRLMSLFESGGPPIRSEAEMLIEEYLQVSGTKREALGIPERPAGGEESPAFEAWHSQALQALREHIHSRPSEQRLSALCLSGGGIRSATFSLGVLQSLAESRRLGDFRYLSTVSGGGYIGAFLCNWLRLMNWAMPRAMQVLAGSAHGRSPGAPVLPAQNPHDPPSADPVSRLRAYSNYLSPMGGISGDFVALLGTFLRNLLLNWCVWLPLIAAALLVPRAYVQLILLAPADPFGWPLGLAIVATVAIVVGIAFVAADLPSDPLLVGPKAPCDRLMRWYLCPTVFAAIVLAMVGAWIGAPSKDLMWWVVGLGAGANLVGLLIGLLWRSKRGVSPLADERALLVSMALLFGAAEGGMLWWLVSSGESHAGHPDDAALLYAVVAVPALLGLFWLAATLYAGVLRRFSTEEQREWWARASGWWLIAAVGWLASFGLVVYLAPLVLSAIGLALPAPAQLGAGGALLGALTSAIGYWSKSGAAWRQRAESASARLGNRLLSLAAGAVLLIIVLTVSLGLSRLMQFCPSWASAYALCSPRLHGEAEFARWQARLSQSPGAVEGSPPLSNHNLGDAAAYTHVLLHTPLPTVCLWLLLLGAGAVLLGNAIGANTFSLHGMYGNRLVRAYLGAGRAGRCPHWMTGFDPGDNIDLAALKPHAQSGPLVLFPVINLTLNLVLPSSRRLDWQQRKAASFTATPLKCGNTRTGYVDTAHYGGRGAVGRGPGMSLGRAMTISGAAASPNMGYHSSMLVTAVMTLFNVRLGWWCANPRRSSPAEWQKAEPPKGMLTLLNEAFGRTTDDRKSLYLSDGGHFENLGLYEMVRRRCHRIVLVDATCDPEFKYADLHNAVRKIRVDFGIRIELPHTLPGQAGAAPCERMAVACIHYSDQDHAKNGEQAVDGVLLILKPLLDGHEPPDIAEYAASGNRRGPRFPHESTADQFFHETQFESYRMLGYFTGRHCLPDQFTWPQWRAPADCQAARPAARRLTKSLRGVVPLAARASREGPASDESGDRAETQPKSPASTSLAGAVRGMGAGAALAAALTVGGTVGVVGTVSLAPSEVSLSKEDRALLRSGLKLQGPAGIPLAWDPAASIPVSVSVAASGAEALGVAAQHIESAASSVERAAQAFRKASAPAVQVQLQPLNLQAFDRVASAADRIASSVDRSASATVALNTAIRGQSAPSSAVLDELRQMNQTLKAQSRPVVPGR